MPGYNLSQLKQRVLAAKAGSSLTTPAVEESIASVAEQAITGTAEETVTVATYETISQDVEEDLLQISDGRMIGFPTMFE